MQEHILLKPQFEKFAENVHEIYKQAKAWDPRNNISESIVVFELAKHIKQHWNNLSVVLEEPYPNSKRNNRCDIVVCDANSEEEWKFALEAKYLFVRGAGTPAKSDVRKGLINDIARLAKISGETKRYLLWVFETPEKSARNRVKYKPGKNFIANYERDFEKLLYYQQAIKVNGHTIKCLFYKQLQVEKIVLPYDKGDPLILKPGTLDFYLLYLQT